MFVSRYFTRLVSSALPPPCSLPPKTAKLELEKTQLKTQLKEKVTETLAELEASLLDKYCYLSFAKVFERNRIRALKVKSLLRRTIVNRTKYCQ